MIKALTSQQKFILKIAPQIKKLGIKYKIIPTLPLSQAALESNWGKSDVAIHSNNIFGIKADKSWKGNSYKGYRSYPSISACIYDYFNFLRENTRYANAGLFSKYDLYYQATVLKQAGYAEAPNYVSAIMNVSIEVNEIYNYLYINGWFKSPAKPIIAISSLLLISKALKS